MEGKITKVGANFFFIDKDYWCGFRSYDRKAVEGDLVSYERETLPDGRKRANRVKFIESGPNPFNDYMEFLSKGYFNTNGQLKDEYYVKFPILLASIFQSSIDKNKSNKIYSFFSYVQVLVGQFKIHKNFSLIRGKILDLKPQVNRSYQRGMVSQEFLDFINANNNLALENEKNFIEGFAKHFECIICYLIKN